MTHLKEIVHYYIGAPIFLCNNIEGNPVIEALTTKMVHEDWEMFFDENDPKPYKPILRRLSDLSTDEWNEIEQATSIMPKAYYFNAVRDNFLIGTSDYRLGWTIINEALILLRKRGVDMDGLIESGQAIDAKEYESYINNKEKQ